MVGTFEQIGGWCDEPQVNRTRRGSVETGDRYGRRRGDKPCEEEHGRGSGTILDV